MKRIATFGEIMIRFDARENERLRQAVPGHLRTSFAGAEANVAVSIAYLGGVARFVTTLPDNALTDGCVAQLNSFGVETRFVYRSPRGRFGTYYVETGANQRPSTVLYDREGSSIALADPSSYAWQEALADVDWFHVTGITPAISSLAAEAVLDSVREARSAGLKVSCDLNFRKKLWRWDVEAEPKALAQRTMRGLLPLVDVLIANEEDASDVLGLRAKGSSVESGVLSLEGYVDLARQIATDFPNLRFIANTLRESVSATHNRWGAMLFDTGSDGAIFAPMEGEAYKPYQITAIVDRVGGGDAFAAALIFALSDDELSAPHDALAFATAASCLAHSVRGDFNLSTRSEVEALAAGSASGRVIR